jgi:hypothetical protein
MDHIAKLANPENRCDDCIQHLGDWCCTMNCSNAETERFRPMGETKTLEVRICDDGYPRWHEATREGWQVIGSANGGTLMMKAAHFANGSKLTLQEPIDTADQPAS